MGYTPAILTGGFDLLALRAAHELGVKHVLCNHFMTQRGKIEGVVPPIVTAQAKADHMIKLCDALGTPPVRCVAVGDGANDIPMLKAAGFGIAFNASERVRDVARISVEGGDLRDILPYIPLPSDAKG
jgi:phosphoserine phosphatase